MNAGSGIILLAATLAVAGAQAEMFGSGANQFSINFANIGYANNSADSSGRGAVGYNYRIGKYEITIDQFAKARAMDNRISGGNEGYWNDGTRTVGTGGPAGYVRWYEAARFANFLTTGDAYKGAYQFSGSGALLSVDRDAAVASYDTVYVLPTEDEWYKAAYYKPIDDGTYSRYASGLDTVPVHGTTNGWNYYNGAYVNGPPNYLWETGYGAEEQNGTFDMMGNVWEWNESAYDGTLDSMTEGRVLRGGSGGLYGNYLRSSDRSNYSPSYENSAIGFRVAAIPEPMSVAFILSLYPLMVFRRHLCAHKHGTGRLYMQVNKLFSYLYKGPSHADCWK